MLAPSNEDWKYEEPRAITLQRQILNKVPIIMACITSRLLLSAPLGIPLFNYLINSILNGMNSRR